MFLVHSNSSSNVQAVPETFEYISILVDSDEMVYIDLLFFNLVTFGGTPSISMRLSTIIRVYSEYEI